MLRRLSRLLNEECSLSLSYEASGIGSGHARYIRGQNGRTDGSSYRVSVAPSAFAFFLFISSWLDNQRDEYVDAISFRYLFIPKHFEKVYREVDRSARRIFRLNQLRFEEKHFNKLLPARAL